MPIILKQAEISYNDNGTYKGINAIAQRSTAQMISQVQAAGAETIAEIEQKIVDSQSAINNIESQKNTMITSIASIAEQGTDTTLTQSGVAADAKVTGDEIRDLKSELYKSSSVLNGAVNLAPTTLSKGYWNNDGTSGGSSSNVYKRTQMIQLNDGVYRIDCTSPGYDYYATTWDKPSDTYTFVEGSKYTVGSLFIQGGTDRYLGITFRKDGGGADTTEILNTLKITKLVDVGTLEVEVGEHETAISANTAKADALDKLVNYANDVAEIELVKGFYLKPVDGKLDVDNPTASVSGWAYGIIECQPNDKFCVNGNSYNGSYPLAWYFLDDEYNILVNESRNVTVTNKILNAPANSAYCVVHSLSPYNPSFKGLSATKKINDVSNNLLLFKQDLEPIEMGGMNDSNGFPTTSQGNNRIRSVNLLPLDTYMSIVLPESGYRMIYYAYAADGTYLGNYDGHVNYIESDDVVTRYPTAKYIRFSVYKSGTNDISNKLSAFQYGTKFNKYGAAHGVLYPELTTVQKTAIQTLADAYYDIKSNFKYLSSSTINNYASTTGGAYTSGKFRICCSLLAELLWMGRSAVDFSDLNSYSNAVTKAFDWGYYFDFSERPLHGLKPNDGYYGYYDPYNDDGKGSYSWNSYNQGSSQVFNMFLYANDMAKEMDRLGYSIPMSALQTGDLIFTKYPTFDPKTDTFDAIAYKNINHVAIVYEKTSSSMTVIESTPRFTDPIHISSSTGTDEEKVRIGYLLGQAVAFARHPAAWGNGGNVPGSITTK